MAVRLDPSVATQYAAQAKKYSQKYGNCDNLDLYRLFKIAGIMRKAWDYCDRALDESGEAWKIAEKTITECKILFDAKLDEELSKRKTGMRFETYISEICFEVRLLEDDIQTRYLPAEKEKYNSKINTDTASVDSLELTENRLKEKLVRIKSTSYPIHGNDRLCRKIQSLREGLIKNLRIEAQCRHIAKSHILWLSRNVTFDLS